jgi:hypothetical protein
MAGYAVRLAKGRFGLRTFITIDTLNLAAEWRGVTQVYLDVVDHPDRVLKIFERGVELNREILELEGRHYNPYNRKVFQNREFCSLAPALEKPLLSVDAFTLSGPQIYKEMGMPYQQRLLDLFGGGHMHMHGTHLYELLPAVAELRGLISIELGDDALSPGDLPPIENLAFIQDELTGEIPLYVHCTRNQFLESLQKRTLQGGIHYCVRGLDSVEEANSIVARTRDYTPRSVC